MKKFKNKKMTVQEIEGELRISEEYASASDEEITEGAERLYDKLKVVNKEYLKSYELLFAFVFAIGGYWGPKLMLIFQKMMRKLEIENEVMQFQTIILMLMKIERVNVEMILEWLERYSNIFGNTDGLRKTLRSCHHCLIPTLGKILPTDRHRISPMH